MADLTDSPVMGNIPAREALTRLGFERPGEQPTEDSSIPDLLLYALVPHAGPRPAWGMVLVVAAYLETMTMYVEGPLHTVLENLARQLRVAADLEHRMENASREAP